MNAAFKKNEASSFAVSTIFFQVGESLGSIIISEKPNFFCFSSQKNFNDVLSPPLTLLNPILEEKKSQFFSPAAFRKQFFLHVGNFHKIFISPVIVLKFSRDLIFESDLRERVCARVCECECVVERERVKRN